MSWHSFFRKTNQESDCVRTPQSKDFSPKSDRSFDMSPPMTDDWRHGPRLLVSRRFGVIDVIRVIGSLAQSFSSWKVYCFCVSLISQQYRKSNSWNKVFQQDHNNIPNMSKPYNSNTALKVVLPSWVYTPGIELQLWGPNEDHNDHFFFMLCKWDEGQEQAQQNCIYMM